KRDCRAVLLNPAVHPARDLAGAVGEVAAWHQPDQRFFFEPGFVDELRALETDPVARPENCLAVIAKGDEVLDWREMAAFCAGARIKLIEGGDHGLADFDRHIDDVLAFLGLA
ncbi:MAG TPA: YqiA/YcfP family alpha/beta fold hydrolase, partial [Ramlibacter sp.]|nr:YqiA/YcfP family alpha/beta fold hydrolase [Ramlibacter sp.]